MADAGKHFREIAEAIRAECERLSALQRSGDLPLLDTGNFSPFKFLGWLNEYFLRTPTLTREEQHALDLVKVAKYLN